MSKRSFATFARFEDITAEFAASLEAPELFLEDVRINYARSKRLATQLCDIQKLIPRFKKEVARMQVHTSPSELAGRAATHIGIGDWNALPSDIARHLMRFCGNNIRMRLVCKRWAQAYTVAHVRTLNLPAACVFKLERRAGERFYILADLDWVNEGVTGCITLHPETRITLSIAKLQGGATMHQMDYFKRLLGARGAQYCVSLTLLSTCDYLTMRGLSRAFHYISRPLMPALPRILMVHCDVATVSVFDSLPGVEHIVFCSSVIFPSIGDLTDIKRPALKSIEFRPSKEVWQMDTRETPVHVIRRLALQRVVIPKSVAEVMHRNGMKFKEWFGDARCVLAKNE